MQMLGATWYWKGCVQAPHSCKETPASYLRVYYLCLYHGSLWFAAFSEPETFIHAALSVIAEIREFTHRRVSANPSVALVKPTSVN